MADGNSSDYTQCSDFFIKTFFLIWLAPCLTSMTGYPTDLGLGELVGCLGLKSELSSELNSYDEVADGAAYRLCTLRP